MTDTAAHTFDVEEQRVRIPFDRRDGNFIAEQVKLSAEAYELDCGTRFSPIDGRAMTAGAALSGAGAAFFKLVGH